MCIAMGYEYLNLDQASCVNAQLIQTSLRALCVPVGATHRKHGV